MTELNNAIHIKSTISQKINKNEKVNRAEP